MLSLPIPLGRISNGHGGLASLGLGRAALRAWRCFRSIGSTLSATLRPCACQAVRSNTAGVPNDKPYITSKVSIWSVPSTDSRASFMASPGPSARTSGSRRSRMLAQVWPLMVRISAPRARPGMSLVVTMRPPIQRNSKGRRFFPSNSAVWIAFF